MKAEDEDDRSTKVGIKGAGEASAAALYEDTNEREGSVNSHSYVHDASRATEIKHFLRL